MLLFFSWVFKQPNSCILFPGLSPSGPNGDNHSLCRLFRPMRATGSLCTWWLRSAVNYRRSSSPRPISPALTMYPSSACAAPGGEHSSHISVPGVPLPSKPCSPPAPHPPHFPSPAAFPRGTSWCLTQSHGVLYSQNQTRPASLRMHHIYSALHGMFSLQSSVAPLSVMSQC